MRESQIFIGNVNICTKYEFKNYFVCTGPGGRHGFGGANYESEIYSKAVPLLKLRDGNYVCINSIDNLDSYIELYKRILASTLNYYLNTDISNITDLILSTIPSEESEIFVDEKSLVPYYDNNLKDGKTTIKKVQKDLMLDPKLPRGKGIDYGHDGVITQPCICKIKRYSRNCK